MSIDTGNINSKLENILKRKEVLKRLNKQIERLNKEFAEIEKEVEGKMEEVVDFIIENKGTPITLLHTKGTYLFSTSSTIDSEYKHLQITSTLRY